MQTDVLDRIGNSIDRMSKSRKRIAEYILRNCDKAAFMNAPELASAVGVSVPTVVRFASLMGYSGYPEFHRALQYALQNRMTTVQRLSLMSGLTSEEVLSTSFAIDMNNLRATEQANSAELIDTVADVLDSARTLYLLGTRSSWPLIQFIDYYMRYMMSNVAVIRFEGSDVYSQMLSVCSDDVLLTVSFPRYSAATIDVMRYLKPFGLPMITLTDAKSSPPALLSDYVLLARSDMNSFVDSFVAPLALINVLIIKLGLRRKDVLLRNFARLEEVWKEQGTYAAGHDDFKDREK